MVGNWPHVPPQSLPSGKRGSAGSWSLWPPHHGGRLGPLFSLSRGSKPKDYRRFQGLGYHPNCPVPLASKVTHGFTGLCCVLSPPYPYLPPPGRPPVLLSPRDPASLSSALPTEGHPRGGSPSLSRHNSLAYQALHGPASAEPWSPGTHNMLAIPLSTLDGCDSRRGSICSRTQIWCSSHGPMESCFQFSDKNSHAGAKSVPKPAQAAPSPATTPSRRRRLLGT